MSYRGAFTVYTVTHTKFIGGGSRGAPGARAPLPEPCLSIVYYGVESKLHAHECVVPPPYTNCLPSPMKFLADSAKSCIDRVNADQSDYA